MNAVQSLDGVRCDVQETVTILRKEQDRPRVGYSRRYDDVRSAVLTKNSARADLYNESHIGAES